jgi:hypothetical protein
LRVETDTSSHRNSKKRGVDSGLLTAIARRGRKSQQGPTEASKKRTAENTSKWWTQLPRTRDWGADAGYTAVSD